ncbi:MAG: hypothetical protein M2R45_03445 [Verrucomicrobia subdivision 3 bacterium]|nr:hypothetical protein [Limisphaerales bacterium]MCS1415737.1 hypothetical protein [Limisphaerales bacterium]
MSVGIWTVNISEGGAIEWERLYDYENREGFWDTTRLANGEYFISWWGRAMIFPGWEESLYLMVALMSCVSKWMWGGANKWRQQYVNLPVGRTTISLDCEGIQNFANLPDSEPPLLELDGGFIASR